MSWAAFHAVECTSSPSFVHKKTGYLAASLSFRPSTDVLILLTNQIRKDLSSTNLHEVSLALECLSVICTPDFTCDLTPDIFALLTSSKNFIRKKLIACLLMVFSQYLCFKRLVENLESSDNAQTLAALLAYSVSLLVKNQYHISPLHQNFKGF
ncbi:hypothetical protein L1887_29681 [Cichorium endivia]|nr:hypothetical protein L1887_29681 [Cichorium endivia]